MRHTTAWLVLALLSCTEQRQAEHDDGTAGSVGTVVQLPDCGGGYAPHFWEESDCSWEGCVATCLTTADCARIAAQLKPPTVNVQCSEDPATPAILFCTPVHSFAFDAHQTACR